MSFIVINGELVHTSEFLPPLPPAKPGEWNRATGRYWASDDAMFEAMDRAFNETRYVGKPDMDAKSIYTPRYGWMTPREFLKRYPNGRTEAG